MIETKGLIAAIEAVDVMLKSANVEIVGNKYHKVKSGIIAVIVTGDVGAVKSAVEAGSEAAKRIGKVLTVDVIARTDNSVLKMLIPQAVKKDKEVELEEKQEKINIKEIKQEKSVQEIKKEEKKKEIKKKYEIEEKQEGIKIESSIQEVKVKKEQVEIKKEDNTQEYKIEGKQEEIKVEDNKKEVNKKAKDDSKNNDKSEVGNNAKSSKSKKGKK